MGRTQASGDLITHCLKVYALVWVVEGLQTNSCLLLIEVPVALQGSLAKSVSFSPSDGNSRTWETPVSHSSSEKLSGEHHSASLSRDPNSTNSVGDPQSMALPLHSPSSSPEGRLPSNAGSFQSGIARCIDEAGISGTSGSCMGVLTFARSPTRPQATADSSSPMSLIFTGESPGSDSFFFFKGINQAQTLPHLSGMTTGPLQCTKS